MGSVSGSVLMKLRGFVSDNPDGVSVHAITLFVALLCICILIGHLLEENQWLNESVISLIIVSTHSQVLILRIFVYIIWSFKIRLMTGFKYWNNFIADYGRSELTGYGIQWRTLFYLPLTTYYI